MPNNCCDEKKYVYSLVVTVRDIGGCPTCGPEYNTSTRLNRYCATCYSQQGSAKVPEYENFSIEQLFGGINEDSTRTN